jgi:hypothetical protein
VANNVATVTACDGSTVAVTLATGTQGAALDAPVVEFDCVVSGPGAVEEAGTRSPLSANFGEREREGVMERYTQGGRASPPEGACEREGRARADASCARSLALNLLRPRCPRCALLSLSLLSSRAFSLSLLSPSLDMSTYHELVKKAAGAYREMFVV